MLTFYLDGTNVQIVTTSAKGNGFLLENARSFPQTELAGFLTTCKDDNCILCCNPTIFYTDTVYLPPSGTKFYDQMVRSEVQKSHPDLGSFSLFYRVIGETTLDGSLYNKIVAFSYPDDSIADVISLFNDNGKTMLGLYVAPYSISRLATSLCPADSQTHMFVASLPGEKLLLLCENAELAFVRSIFTEESSFFEQDIQNINMTVDYCYQTLRVKPSELVLVNGALPEEEIVSGLSLPMSLLSGTPRIQGSSEDISLFLAPLAAALNHHDAPGIGSILPADYHASIWRRSVVRTASVAVALLTLIAGGVLAAQTMVMFDLKDEVSRYRAALREAPTVAASFQKAEGELQRFDKLISYLNNMNSINASKNQQAALVALDPIRMKGVQIKSISLKRGETAIDTRIEGQISATGYKETQIRFEELTAALNRAPGYSVVSSRMDIQNGSFSIDARTVADKGGTQ